MPEDFPIPHGYKRVFGQAQKGDGMWSYKRRRFIGARMAWPDTEALPVVLIRKCAVVQTGIPGTEERTISVTNGNGKASTLNRADYETLKKMGMLWEHHPDAPADWPFPEEPLNLDE